jgi:putative ABC transport system ATP-binding protein
MSEILVARDVRKVYRSAGQETEALRGVDLVVEQGEWVSVMGPSGCGKTTLLNCLSGLDDIDGGEVSVAGTPLHAMSDAERTKHRASAMGFIFQAYNLIPVFSAVENVELPLLLAGVDHAEARRRASETLERIGMGHRLRNKPGELSGGEQQRVTVARALAGRPAIVWADEPTGALDSETAGVVMGLLGELNRTDGLTLVVVTHDREVGAQAGRMVTMRDGRVVDDQQVAALS